MEIKIITIHAMHNPGSVLQAYALQEFLKSKNYNVEIIDYRPDYFYNEGKKLKLFLKKFLYRKSYKSRNLKFINFINNNMKLTDTYKTFNDLNSSTLSADVYIVGSDQLWNTDFPCGNDIAFYLKFAKKGKKISYSTSVGKKEIDENNKKMLIENLKEFKSIAVREKSTSIQLAKLLNRDVYWVCDPVLLLDKEKYSKFITENSPFNKKYIMIYLAPKSEILDSIVKRYKEEGYYIVLAGGMTKRCYCDKHIIDVGPEEFLNLIYHAEVVISTSFHATVFCHIFQKEFVSLLPKRNGERINSLLEQTGLENRAVGDMLDFNTIFTPIDWDNVNLKLNEYIESSKAYLDNAIKE